MGWSRILRALCVGAALICGVAVPASANSLLQLAQADQDEAAFWARVKDSSDPLILEMYIRAFPSGAHVPEAHARIQALRAGHEPAAAAVKPARDYPADEKGWLGAEIQLHTLSGAEAGKSGRERGVKVVSLSSYGPGKRGGLLPGDIITAIDGENIETLQGFVKRIGEKGAGSVVTLGLIRGGVAQDMDLALGGRITDSLAAAQDGDALAQLQIGYAYATGQGIEKDAGKGFHWYAKAANQGLSHAQANMGNAYFYGRGVTKDPAVAVQWYRRAAEQNHANAQTHMGYAFANGIGVKKDDAQAVDWYRRAIANGEPYAMNNMALMYEAGRGGLSKDRDKALELWRRAARLGNDLAGENLEKRNESIHDIAEVQRLLADLGFDPGPIDGKMGKKTAAAIREAEAHFGLIRSGAASQKLIDRLRTEVAARGNPDAGSQPVAATSGGKSQAGDPTKGIDLGDLDSLE